MSRKPRKAVDAEPGAAVTETTGADQLNDDRAASPAEIDEAESVVPPESESIDSDVNTDSPEMTAAVDADESHAEIKMGRKQRRRQEADAHSA